MVTATERSPNEKRSYVMNFMKQVNAKIVNLGRVRRLMRIVPTMLTSEAGTFHRHGLPLLWREPNILVSFGRSDRHLSICVCIVSERAELVARLCAHQLTLTRKHRCPVSTGQNLEVAVHVIYATSQPGQTPRPPQAPRLNIL